MVFFLRVFTVSVYVLYSQTAHSVLLLNSVIYRRVSVCVCVCVGGRCSVREIYESIQNILELKAK